VTRLARLRRQAFGMPCYAARPPSRCCVTNSTNNSATPAGSRYRPSLRFGRIGTGDGTNKCLVPLRLSAGGQLRARPRGCVALGLRPENFPRAAPSSLGNFSTPDLALRCPLAGQIERVTRHFKNGRPTPHTTGGPHVRTRHRNPAAPGSERDIDRNQRARTMPPSAPHFGRRARTHVPQPVAAVRTDRGIEVRDGTMAAIVSSPGNGG
jgi:hypothetical protein